MTFADWVGISLISVQCSIMVSALMFFVAYSVVAERRFSAWIQDRIGPNRVGIPLGGVKIGNFTIPNLRLLGLGQPIADGLKFILKEEITPGHVNKPYYYLAPALSMVPALLAVTLVPVSSGFDLRPIGAWIGGGMGFSRSNIDDVAIYDEVLVDTEILALSLQSVSPLGLRGSSISDFPKIEGVTAAASSELTASFNRGVGNIVDGIGRTTTSPDGDPGDVEGMWLSSGVGFPTGEPDDTDPFVDFDLGALHSIDAVSIFNYNEALTGRGVDEFEILVSNDNFASDIRSLGTESLLIGTGDENNPQQIISLGGIAARYVRFDILSNHNDVTFPDSSPDTDFGFVGLNQVEFFGAPIPEPTGAALALLGAAALVRRRQRA